MFEVWGHKGEDNLVYVELDSILRSKDNVSVVSVDPWVRRCRGTVGHGGLHVLCAARDLKRYYISAVEKTLVKEKMLPTSEVPKQWLTAVEMDGCKQ